HGVKLLLLHGGPGSTHDYLEAFDAFLPAAGIEYYYYDQLGAGKSDSPDEASLWDLGRFVDELEQVREALGLDARNLCLYGHSWGGILAIEYALAHQDRLKALVVSNMMASIASYNAYAERVLAPQIESGVLAEVRRLEAEGRTEEPRYMELLIPHFYERHILRMPEADWPEPVKRAFALENRRIYVPMQGPSELGASGALLGWDRFDELARIEVPALVIGAEHDTMESEHLRSMASRLPRGRYHHCPEGSHLAMWDDQETYFRGLLGFIGDVEAGRI
ncbi:MAG TPA: proline iminopeptidase-family hydrolase, partial [Rectinemataceae bacterium]|nr:proline iminopeptidase-family hydrolase [Rectinemataceae bacterium]